MDAAAIPDLLVQVSRRRIRCVIDPHLALSRDGAALVRLLAPYAESWVVPELFAVLDSARLYTREPELLIWPDTDPADIGAVPGLLRDWMQLREEAGRSFYWVGDALRESYLPDEVEESVVIRWEAAARTLDSRLPQNIEATGPLIAAMRDAAALAAVLPHSCILARGRRGEAPLLCSRLREWGITCERLTGCDDLASIERAAFLRLLVAAEITPMIWSGLQLAVVHLLVPHSGRLCPSDDFAPEPVEFTGDEIASHGHPWQDAQCFWYDLTGQRSEKN